MRSSTSNSSERPPRLAWLRVWGCGLLVVAVAIGCVEWFYRAHGYRPSVTNTMGLWSFHRSRASRNDPQTLVLLGASRIQLAFSTDAFRSRFPEWKVIQLAIPDAGPVATLRSLAEDERFRGVVLCSANGRWLDRSTWNNQRKYVEHYSRRAMSINRDFNDVIRAALQSQFALASSELGARRLLQAVLRGARLPKPRYVRMRFDRSRDADFRLLDDFDLDGRKRRLTTRYRRCTPSLGEWLRGTRYVDLLVEAIQERGGRVAFVQLPTGGEVDRLMESYFPKTEAWDRFAASSSAVTIHFRDRPTLSSFVCPDEAHLDQRDKDEFTDRLLDELIEEGVFPG